MHLISFNSLTVCARFYCPLSTHSERWVRWVKRGEWVRGGLRSAQQIAHTPHRRLAHSGCAVRALLVLVLVSAPTGRGRGRRWLGLWFESKARSSLANVLTDGCVAGAASEQNESKTDFKNQKDVSKILCELINSQINSQVK